MATVSGKVTRTQDTGGPVPLENVPVVLLFDNGNGVAIRSGATGPQGGYSFTDVPAGARCVLVFPTTIDVGGSSYELADAVRVIQQSRRAQSAKYVPETRTSLATVLVRLAALEAAVNDPATGLGARLTAAEITITALDTAVYDPATGLGARLTMAESRIAAIEDPAAGILFQATRADTGLETRLQQQQIDPLKANLGALLQGRKPIPNADLL